MASTRVRRRGQDQQVHHPEEIQRQRQVGETAKKSFLFIFHRFVSSYVLCSWTQCGALETPTGTEPLATTIDGLVEKDKLQFRVIAVNAAGESKPSDPSDMHTVKHRKRKKSQHSSPLFFKDLPGTPFVLKAKWKTLGLF